MIKTNYSKLFLSQVRFLQTSLCTARITVIKGAKIQARHSKLKTRPCCAALAFTRGSKHLFKTVLLSIHKKCLKKNKNLQVVVSQVTKSLADHQFILRGQNSFNRAQTVALFVPLISGAAQAAGWGLAWAEGGRPGAVTAAMATPATNAARRNHAAPGPAGGGGGDAGYQPAVPARPSSPPCRFPWEPRRRRRLG